MNKYLLAYSAHSRSSLLKPILQAVSRCATHEVRIRVTHCGLCRSDVHLLDNDWSMTRYPFVPGHEVVGLVEEKGSGVRHVSVGDRVGVGWQRGSCGSCRWCRSGEENLCSRSLATCVGHSGGFASYLQIDGRFAFSLPKRLPSAQAAPLLCGGITVYTPLVSFNIPKSGRIGILGIGGLGHLAIQFARALGFHVTALSSTRSKRAQARKLGAHEFLWTRDQKVLKKYNATFDFVLSTVNSDLDWSTYFQLVGPKGKFCFVGAPGKPLTLPIYELLHGQRAICGSPIGGRRLIKEMLTFAAAHNIKAQVEVQPMSEINDAIQRLRDNKVRYRMVLTNSN